MKQIITLLFTTLSLGLSGVLKGQEAFNMELLAQVQQPFPTNDIWGYVSPSGVEYAVVGTERDCRIYSLEDPESPSLVQVVPGANSIWRDYKSYDEYVYGITQVGNDGLTIIDMRGLPFNATAEFYTRPIDVGNGAQTLSTCHNLWIDTERGLAFLAGCNIGVGGILIFDLTENPLAPIYIGAINERYSHDVVTKGDTLFSSEINEGNLGIYDISNINNPQLISRTRTSSSFTHNAWPSDDGQFVFTTDERPNSFIDAYDISNLSRPARIDQYQPVPDAGIIPHNTHYHNGFLVTSWYTEGIVVLDAQRPDNLVKVGQYDTFLPQGNGFQGAWGAYPYLPSGIVLASDISGGLFVLNPSYDRAAYLEGEIIDIGSGFAVNAATIRILDGQDNQDESNALGVYKTGTALSGSYEVVIEHPDFETLTAEVELEQGVVVERTFRLTKSSSIIDIAGKVVRNDGTPIPEAKILMESAGRIIETSTDAQGLYQVVAARESFDIYVAAWGYQGRVLTRTIREQLQDDIVLLEGYEDDFFVDLGWETSNNARRGFWERAIPKGTFFAGKTSNPDADIPDDLNSYCYVTGNDNVSAAADDVDDGTVTLLSPPIDVSENKNAIIEISPWFYNDGGNSTPNDSMKIYLVGEGREFLVHVITDDTRSSGVWRDPLKIYVDSIFKRDKSVRVKIEVTDHPGTGHLVEGGIDRFRMYEGPLPVFPFDLQEIEVIISPNPTSGIIYIEPQTNELLTRMLIFSMKGEVLFDQARPDDEMDLSELIPGTYILEFHFVDGVKTRKRLIKH